MQTRSVGVLALSSSLALAVWFAATASAATYTLTAVNPTVNWSDTTKWNGGIGSTYPGQNAGDTAIVSLNGFTLNIDVAIANALVLQISGTGVNVQIPAGSALHIANASSGVSASTINVNGGTFGIAAGNSVTNYASPITINSGTFDAAGSLAFQNGTPFTFNGGTISGSGTITTPAATTFSINCSGGSTAINGAVINNSGTINYTCSGGNFLTLQAGASILNGGTIAIQTDQPIASDNVGNPSITNGGTIAKSGGTSTTIAPALNNSGSLSPGGARLVLTGGGTQSGTLNLSNAAGVIEFGGGTHDVNSGANVSGTGGLVLSAGTLNVTAALSANTFTQSGTALLTGTQTLTASTLNWTGGTMSGSGGVTVSGTGNINGSSATTLTNGWTLTNSGTTHYSPTAPLTISNGAKVSNSGTWSLENNTAILSNLASSPQFTNSGTLTKTIGGTTPFGVPLVSSNVITLSGGSDLQVNGGGQVNGTITLTSASDILDIASSVTTTSTPAFSGLGLLRIQSGGTLFINAAAAIARLELDAGGTLDGTATLSISNNLKWTGGSMNGSGTTLLSAGATADVTATSPSLTSGRSFTNSSGAVFDVQTDGTLSGNGTFTNSGTLKKSAGSGTFTVGVLFTNSNGLVDAQSGTIALTGTGDQMSAGTMQTASGATIDIPSGTFTISGGSLAGTGTMRVIGGTLIANATVTLPQDFRLLSGTLQGSSTFIVPASAVMTWSGGTVDAPLQVNAGGDVAADSTASALTMNAHTLIVATAASFDWNAGANALSFTNAASLANNGTFTVATNATLDGASAASSTNIGLFRHTGSGTLTVTLPLNNSFGGTISEQGSTLVLQSASSVAHAGTFDAQNGKTIRFAAGTQTMNTGAAFTATTGLYDVNGATLTLLTNISAPNVHLTSGAINGSGNLTTTIDFTWSGGAMSGSGTTNVSSGTAALLTGPLALSRNLTLGGNTTFNAANAMAVSGGVTITNNATFDVQQGNISCTCTPTPSSFVNNSVLQSSTTTPRRTIDVPVSGSGTANVAAGWLALTNAASFASASIASGGTLELGGGTATVGGVTGSGRLLNVSASTTVSGAVSLPAPGSIEVQSGTLTLNSTTSAGTLLMTGGTVNGGGNITIATLTWQGGALAGSGTATANTTLAIQGSSAPMTLSRTLINSGTASYTAPSATNILTVVAPGAISNNGSFTLSSAFDLAASGAATFTNASGGTLTANGATFAPALMNSGTVQLSSNTTNFTNGFMQTIGSTQLAGGNASSSSFAFNGGSVTGNGTLTGPVTNSGATIDPSNGLSAGTITINGAFTQTGGTLNSDLYAAGVNDKLAVSGAVTLDGILKLTPVAFTPANGDTFPIITGASVSDTSTKQYAPFGFNNTGSFNTVLTPASLSVVAVIPQVDVAISASAPSTVAHTLTWPVTLTIQNIGGTTATNVQVSITATNGPIAGATSATFSCSGSTSAQTCTAATLAGGATATITVNLTATTIGPISLGANITATEQDPNGANNATSASATVNANADLSLAIGDAPDPVNAGQTIVYTYTATNNGPDAAVANVSASITNGNIASVGAGCTQMTPTTAACTSASIASSSNASFTINVTAPGAGPTSASGSVATSAGTVDLNSANDSASQSTSVTPVADVALSMNAPTSVAASTNISYAITLTNNGPSTAQSVTLIGAVPANTTFVSLTQNSGPTFSCTTPLNCSIASLAASASAIFTFVVNVNAATPTGTVITNTANAATSTNDPSSSNNTASANTTVAIGTTDLAIAMTPSAAPYGTGQTITYNIVVTNGGVVPANNVSVTDTLPAGTALLSAVASQGSCGGAPAITCSLGTLAAGGSATVTLQLTLPSTPGNVANTANVSTSNPDPNNANDSVTVAVNVIPAAQLPATSALLLLLLAFALIAIAFLRH